MVKNGANAHCFTMSACHFFMPVQEMVFMRTKCNRMERPWGWVAVWVQQWVKGGLCAPQFGDGNIAFIRLRGGCGHCSSVLFDVAPMPELGSRCGTKDLIKNLNLWGNDLQELSWGYQVGQSNVGVIDFSLSQCNRCTQQGLAQQSVSIYRAGTNLAKLIHRTPGRQDISVWILR